MNPRVLLVDDNFFNLKLAQHYLMKLGVHEIDTALDGRQCLERLGENAYDLVFLDMQMPVMDGYTAVREIRKHEGWKELPVVALTASAMVGDAERCLDAGCTAYLAKPFNVEGMSRMLRAHLPAAKLPPSIVAGAEPQPPSVERSAAPDGRQDRTPGSA